MSSYSQQEYLKKIYSTTKILRKPISGIISGYHELPYILIAPDEDNNEHTIEVNGIINVSPKFIISPTMLQETFGDVFDPETFDKNIVGRLFSFAYAGKKNVKIESKNFTMKFNECKPEEHLTNILDRLMREENTRTGLIYCPHFFYYPISIDRIITEIVDREFSA